jgi:zinc-finger binding domain of transposase IS66
VVPPAACSGCGAGLAGVLVLAQRRHQVTDIEPAPPPKVTQYVAQARQCPRCAAVTEGTLPAFVRARASYGPETCAQAANLACGNYIPVAVSRAMDQFRWFTGGWRVNAELPVPESFDAASETVREEDVSTQMPCGPDVERHVAGIREFAAAGFTHVALVQIGGDTQERFITWAATELLPALRAS